MNRYDEDYEDEVRMAENMFHAEHECYDKCPYCGEILWIEWGFQNPTLCMIQEWYNYAYPYRPVSLYSIGDIYEYNEEVIR